MLTPVSSWNINITKFSHTRHSSIQLGTHSWQKVNQPDKLEKALKSMFESDETELIEVPVEGKI